MTSVVLGMISIFAIARIELWIPENCKDQE